MVQLVWPSKVLKDSEDKTHLKEIEYSTLPEIPEGILYTFIQDAR